MLCGLPLCPPWRLTVVLTTCVLLPFPYRNRIPEKKGTWMEEWHQKLHNNTTPDDVPICSAYIAFLEVRSGPFSFLPPRAIFFLNPKLNSVPWMVTAL